MVKKTTDSNKIKTLKELQLLLPKILKMHGSDTRLTLAALANPLLALESAGYSFDPDLRKDLALRIRFGEEKSKKLQSLQKQIFKLVGKSFDLNSPAELKKAIEPVLLSEPEKKRQDEREATIKTILAILEKPLLPQLRWNKQAGDPLQKFEKFNELLSLLVEYRRLEASEPRLADHKTFNRLLKGEISIPVKKAQFRLKAREERKQSKKG